MVEFIVDRKEFTGFVKAGCLMKTPKSKPYIPVLQLTAQGNQLIGKGIDTGAVVMSCVRMNLSNAVKEEGTFVFDPVNIMGLISQFGDELIIRTSEEKFFVIDIDKENIFSELLPAQEIEFPVDFNLKDDVIEPSEKVKLDVVTDIRTDIPNIKGDITLSFTKDGVRIGIKDELSSYQRTLGTLADLPKNFKELQVKVDGTIINKVAGVLGDYTRIGANEKAVYIYTRYTWGDAAYLIATVVE